MEESPSGAGSHKRTRPVEAAGAADAQTRPPRLGKHCAFSPSFHRALPHHKHTQRKTRKSTGHWASWSPFSQFRTHMNFRRASLCPILLAKTFAHIEMSRLRRYRIFGIGLIQLRAAERFREAQLLVGGISSFAQTFPAFAVNSNWQSKRLHTMTTVISYLLGFRSRSRLYSNNAISRTRYRASLTADISRINEVSQPSPPQPDDPKSPHSTRAAAPAGRPPLRGRRGGTRPPALAAPPTGSVRSGTASNLAVNRRFAPQCRGPILSLTGVLELLHPLHLIIPIPHDSRLGPPLPQHAVQH